MIKIGDVVFVQTKGICKVENITKNAFVGADKTKEYYVLKPVGVVNDMMIYFPTDTKVNIRKLTSKAKAESIFNGFKNLDSIVVNDGEDKLETYNELSKNGELEDRAKLLKTLLIKKSKTNKKQFAFQEQKIINLMLGCVVSELSYVLGKEESEVKSKLFEDLCLAEEN